MLRKDSKLKATACGLGLSLLLSLQAFAQEPVTASSSTPLTVGTIVAPVPAEPVPGIKMRATQQDLPPTTGETLASPSAVLSGAASNEIENLSKQILRDEIALQKFNLAFRSNVAKQGRWKGWRYFFFQEGGLALTKAGLIVGVSERGAHLRGTESRHNSLNTLGNGGVLPGAIGQMLGATGSGLELGINKYHSYQAGKKGFGFKQARDTAIKLVGKIDAEMAQREKLIQEQPASDREISQMQELEGCLLVDFRDLAVAEFERYHIIGKKTLMQQNSFYALDIVKNTSGIVGSFLCMHSILTGARVYNLSGGIMNTISGAMIMADPVISRLIGDAAARRDQSNLVKHGLPLLYEKAEKLDDDHTHLMQFCRNHQLTERPEMSSLLARVEAYDANHAYFVDETQRREKELRAGNRTAIQNIATSSFVGATKTAGGILTTKCGASYVTDGIRTNNNLFVANLVSLPGVSWALVDNVRIQTQREIKQRKLAKEGKLPGQLIKQRLDELNALEKRLQ